MEELHSSLNNIYELMVDKEYAPLRSEINSLTKKLKRVGESITHEV